MTSPNADKRACVECKAEFVLPPDMKTFYAKKRLSLPKRCKACRNKKRSAEFKKALAKDVAAAAKPFTQEELDALDTAPDWSRSCESCGAKPVVPLSGMCGPCTFGEAEAAGGNW